MLISLVSLWYLLPHLALVPGVTLDTTFPKDIGEKLLESQNLKERKINVHTLPCSEGEDCND